MISPNGIKIGLYDFSDKRIEYPECRGWETVFMKLQTWDQEDMFQVKE